MEQYHIETAFVMPFNNPYMLSMDFKVQTVHSNLLDIAAALRPPANAATAEIPALAALFLT